MPVALSCSSRPCDDVEAEPHHFTAEGPTYPDAYAAAHASLPEGWLLLHVRTNLAAASPTLHILRRIADSRFDPGQLTSGWTHTRVAGGLMDREPCTWAECGRPAVAITSTGGFEDVWVCEEHLDEAILRDPDRDVWRIYDIDEATG